ncbi:type II secretion system secretin GspD [Leisingera sp. ANG-M7]|uniref:type II secretion system secretin GspD n=1 Tax=Leisingera sp. ANG-M7 TaxID=1577902 RepID=UPI0009DFF1A1|nr:type II secretion system secretin GspD [Leisingera sp. ANG-M7]
MRFRILTWALAALTLASCTETTTTSSGLFGDDVSVARSSFLSRNQNQATQLHGGVRPGAMSRGTDQFVNPSILNNNRSQAVVIPKDGKLVEVSLVNASIEAAAQAVLGEALGKNYTVADELKGRITIQSTGAIPKTALLELFEAALSANDARLEQDGNVIKVLPGTSGNKTFRLASSGVGSGASIVVAPLKHISAAQMVNLLAPLSDEGLRTVADKRRNLLMMTGTKKQLEAALDALNLFDVDVLSGKSIALVELNSADPESIVDELAVIFENEVGGNLEGVIEFIPNKRLGSVLIITSRSKYLPVAQKWIRELDRTASGASRYIETYELDNRDAVDVAPILNDLLSSSQEKPAEGEDTSRSVSGSRVAADKARNALLVRATRSEHREIQSLLNEIDDSPQQVMLEATIAEVTLNDELGLGVRWFFESGNFDFTFSDSDSGSTSSRFPGFSAVFGTNSAAAAINALAGVTDVKIISSPTLMVLDNEEAILQIGDQVPVATQSSTSTSTEDAPTITTIEYRDTGVILKVQPKISRNGRVVLDVTQEVSSVAETVTSGIDSPTIRQRKVATNVLLNDGTTLALGGLVQESDTTTVTKVPGLGDVPVLGNVFRNKDSKKRRSELLVLIRPRVVNTESDARTITEHWRTKLSGANTILRTGLGKPQHQIGEFLQ